MRLPSLVLTALISALPVSGFAAERLNHTISVLESGGAAFGIFSGDRSPSNARRLARSDLDYVFIDMEHGPYDAESLQQFLFAMTDKAAIAESGSLTMNTTPIVRLPINGREMNQALVKQVLDLGVYGVMFPMINNRE
ncbi:MAG: aldolase/citrate lyase family protein [Pseudomonadota bacterium]